MKTNRIPIQIRKWQILIPLIFLGLYLTYLYDIADEPFFKYLVVNPLVYDNDARLILQGIPSSQPFFLSPLFPGWLASVYSITNSSRLAVAVINGIVGMLSVYLIGAITRQLFGEIAGLVSSLIAIGYWCLYYFCGELMPTILCISAVLASTYCIIATTAKEMRIPLFILGLISIGFISHINPAVKSLRTSRPSYLGNPIANLTFLLVFIGGVTILLVIFSNPKLKNRACYAVGGLLAGLSMLLWSGTALYSLILTVYIAIKRVEKSAVIGWLVGILIPLAASTCHNYVITTDLIPLTTSFGVNLFIGNNPTSDGMNPFNFGTQNNIRIEADRRGLSGKARSDFFKQKAMEFIRNQKVKWVKLLGRKALISISRAEVSNNADISERKQSWRMAPIAFVDFGVILPLALIGLASSFKKSEGGLLLFLGFICFMIIQIALFACERFRIPGSALLIPLAGYGVVSFMEKAKRNLKEIIPLAILAGAAAVISNYDFLSLSRVEFAAIVSNKAYVARLDGDFEKSQKLARKAIQLEPATASAYFQLGAIEEQLGNSENAIEYYLISLRNDPFFIASYNGARRVLDALRISTGYLDFYIDQLIRGEESEDTAMMIQNYVEERTQGRAK